jgi:DNA-binding NtrC family response regulator
LDSVLVVDDEPSLAGIVGELVSGMGFGTRVAYSGDAALERLRDEAFDIVLCDVMMPGLCGAALIRAMRDVRPQSSLVLMSSLPEAHVRATIPGAYAFLQKPFSITALETVLHGARGGGHDATGLAMLMLATPAFATMLEALGGR